MYWNNKQLYTMQALGLKRFLYRFDNEKALPTPNNPFTEIIPEKLEITEPKLEIKDSPVLVADFPPQEINLSDGRIIYNRRYSFIERKSLKFNYLLPPLTGFLPDLKLLNDEDAELFLLALRRSDLEHEAFILAELLTLNFHEAPQNNEQLKINSHKKTVILGRLAKEALLEEEKNQILLFHPSYVRQQSQFKFEWWQQILTLKI